MCLPVSLIQGFQDVVVLSKIKEELEGLPECKGS